MGPRRRGIGDIATLEIYILLAVAPAGGGRFDCYPSRTGQYSHSGDILSNAATLETYFVAVTPAGQDNAATLELYCQMQLHWRPILWAVTPAGGRDVLSVVTPAGQDNIATLEIYFGCYSSRRERCIDCYSSRIWQYSHIGDIFGCCILG